MANKKITDLTDIGTPDPLDVLEIVDVSTNTSKKVLFSELGGGGGSQSLDEVLAVGNTANLKDAILVADGLDDFGNFIAKLDASVAQTKVSYQNIEITDSDSGKTILGWGFIYKENVLGNSTILQITEPTEPSGTINIPDVAGATETLALLSDIPTVGNATETVAGIAEIATTAEVTTGTDDERIVTPLKLKAVTDLKVDKTEWIDYSAISTVVGWSSFTVKDIEYMISGNICNVRGLIAGTSNSTTTSFTLPLNYTGTNSYGVVSVSYANSGTNSTIPGIIRIISNTSEILFFRDGTLLNFSATGTKQINFNFSFKIN